MHKNLFADFHLLNKELKVIANEQMVIVVCLEQPALQRGSGPATRWCDELDATKDTAMGKPETHHNTYEKVRWFSMFIPVVVMDGTVSEGTLARRARRARRAKFQRSPSHLQPFGDMCLYGIF